MYLFSSVISVAQEVIVNIFVFCDREEITRMTSKLLNY
jgi:hypothetical protein